VNGSGTDASYDRIGQGYASFRKPDPRIEARLISALGAARTVVNIGAGTGSYEPTDRVVVAVEPSDQKEALMGKHSSSDEAPSPPPPPPPPPTTVTIEPWRDPSSYESIRGSGEPHHREHRRDR